MLRQLLSTLERGGAVSETAEADEAAYTRSNANNAASAFALSKNTNIIWTFRKMVFDVSVG